MRVPHSSAGQAPGKFPTRARRDHVVAALVILVMAAVLILPALRSGTILAPVDLYYETPVYADLRPDNFDEAENPHLFDQAYQFVPWRQYAWERMREGDLPLWNPYSAAGTPFIATMQSAVFYPINVLTLPLPFATTFVASAMLRLWVAGFCTYLLLRRYRVSTEGALLGGVSFMLSGFVVSWLGHPHTNVAVWLPALILGVELLVSSSSRRAIMRAWALIAIVTGIQFLGGHIETSRDILFAAGLYAFLRVIQRRGLGSQRAVQKLALAATAVFVGAGVAAVQLMPFLEWLPLSAEFQQRSGTGFDLWHLDLRSVLALPLAVMPSLYNNPTWEGPYWSFNPWGSFNESVLYAGVIPVGLAVAALRTWNTNQIVRVWGPMTGLMLALALRLPLVDWINQIPGFALAHPNRLRLIAIFGVTVLAGHGLDVVMNDIRARRWAVGTLGFVATIVTAVFLVFNVVFPRMENWSVRLVQRVIDHFAGAASQPRSVSICQERVAACAEEVERAFAITSWEMYLALPIAILAIFAIARFSGTSRRGRLLGLSLLVLTGVELLLVGWGYNPAVDADAISRTLPIVDAATASAGDARIVTLHQDSLPDTHMLYDVREVRGLDFKTAWMERYLDASEARIAWLGHGVLFSDVDPLVAELNVGAVITSNPHIVERQTSNGSMMVTATVGNLTVLVPRDPVPNAEMRFDIELVESEEVLARMLNATPQRVTSAALLIDSPQAREADAQVEADDADAFVVPLRSEPEFRSWSVSTAETGVLVVTDAYYPGWRAEVDGEPVEILRTNLAFRGVVVPPGEHIVEMRYEPDSMRAGIAVSAVSIVIVFGVLGASFAPANVTARWRVH